MITCMSDIADTGVADDLHIDGRKGGKGGLDCGCGGCAQ